MARFKVGDRVIFANGMLHKYCPVSFPEVRTVGTVTKVNTAGFLTVRWDNGHPGWYEGGYKPEDLEEAKEG